MLVFQGMFSSFYVKHSKDRRKIDGSKILSRPKKMDSSDESMDFSGSCKGWDRWHSPSPNWQEGHTTYIPLIVLAEPGGPHIIPSPPFMGTSIQQPLNEFPKIGVPPNHPS